VKKKQHKFLLNNTEEFKIKMLNWSNLFNIFCFLDSNQYQSSSTFDCILAIGSKKDIQLNTLDSFSELKLFNKENNDWLFGHFNYPSLQKDEIGFPSAFFFIPQILIQVSGHTVIIESDIDEPEIIYYKIEEQPDRILPSVTNLNIRHKISETQYLDAIIKLKEHIQRGDCYEINFCQEFFAENAFLNPISLFHQLNTISPNPFAAFYKLENKFCICASPERFIKKSGNTILSQPIKGTSKRYINDFEKDEASKSSLFNSPKERSENVMIVDLVRNDLSKICLEGSVVVKELFGIYSFPQVHQMISTIEGKVNENIHWTDIIEACYPMGSMTGAPKKRVMELIELYEASPRGLFSGSIGYVSPDGDFDFNVVIRSLFYNQSNNFISFKAGGGITFHSDPLQEYQESLIKASAIKKILQSSEG
jgi:para-aminobenzoate synthetase component 1